MFRLSLALRAGITRIGRATDNGRSRGRSRCSRRSDLSVHDAPIPLFTIGRFPQVRRECAVSELLVEVAGARIAVRRGFDAALLTAVVRALKEER